MDQKARNELFRRLSETIKNPTSELVYHSHFELLISVMLSAQATDISVNKATEELYKIANTPEKILLLGEDGLKHYIKRIGLYNTKAKNIIKTCECLVQKHHSEVPSTRDALESFPGVGRKTANVVLNTAFGEPTVAVDTHIFRVANRTVLATGKTPLAVEKKLLASIPTRYLKDGHHLLLLHGRYTCTARSPKCPTCVIKDICEYRYKSIG